MEAEIELKLFFPKNEREALVSLLDSLPHSETKGSKHLTNSYFDTQDLQLRKWDMGLRIRGCNGRFEQTIKTAGTVIGGVHSRPEYNIDIDQAKVNLALFPDSIWPEEADLVRVNSELYCLFDTDFTRQTWHIYIDESLVEVALDIGSIRAGGMSEPICELEFELLAGDTQALLSLGERVTAQIPARLGQASKAQRGYRLAAMSSPLQLETLAFIQLGEVKDLKQAFITLLSTGLERWQGLEAMLLDANLEQLPLLSYRLRSCIRLLRCSLSQFDLLTPQLDDEFAGLEGYLEFVEQGQSLVQVLQDDELQGAGFPDDKAEALIELVRQQLHGLNMSKVIHAMLQDIRYGHLQLTLVNLLFGCRAGKLNLTKQQDLQQFADEMQEASWQRIVKLMPSEVALSSDDYQQFAKALDESFLVGRAYGELYSPKARDLFRAPWQDLILGIRTLRAYRLLRQLGSDSALQLWLDNKEQSLLFAMEHTRRSALKAQPYWR